MPACPYSYSTSLAIHVILQVKDRLTNMIRKARSYNLKLAKEDGRLGGSGNGRDLIDDIPVPPFFEELKNAGALNRFLAHPRNVISGTSKSTSLTPGPNDPTDVASGEEEDDDDCDYEEEADLYGGNEAPPTQEPYGGRGEAHQQALKRKATNEEDPGEITEKNRGGRPNKQRMMVQELVSSMGGLNASAAKAGGVLATAIQECTAAQIAAAAAEGQKEREWRAAEAQKDRETLLAAMRIIAEKLI